MQASHFYKEGLIHQCKGQYQEAARWYTMAAELGYPKAAHHLGLMYLSGTAVDKDLDKAKALLL